MIENNNEKQAEGGSSGPYGSSDSPNLRAWWKHNDQFATDYRSEEERAALNAMWEQYNALRNLGWSDAIYCPKDGSRFLSISAGSTGIHECYYEGEWPKGSWWVHDGGDLWPSHPILWKPLPPNAEVRDGGLAASNSTESANPPFSAPIC